MAAKDVFIVHTKSLSTDRVVADAVARVLVAAGLSVYGANDWQWQSVTRSRDWQRC